MDRGRGKNTKYFSGLEKTRQAKKSISKLKDVNGNITEDQGNILEISRNYYEKLYSSTNPDCIAVQDYINNTEISKSLNNEEAEQLEGELTIKECTTSVFAMKLNKTCGRDGLSVEFYRTYWEYLKDFITSVFNSCYLKKELSESQKNRNYNSYLQKE